ncbi:MAG: UDP-N-acetylmuramate--L-alanine ligase [Clostridia bacterium]|nr:UDP-N-acetylmuramate--L-alanine ligase [Clostridia bacterium]
MFLKGLKGKKFYFIGIGGISMSALAKLLKTSGYSVAGSDGARGEETENLAFYGVKAYIGVDGERKELIEADGVVYTDAIAADNAELLTAKRLQKRIYARAELLQIVCAAFPHTLAVAGSHGKTTCTSMCAHILKAVGVPFTAHIGGEDGVFGNFYTTGREYFVTEACEYKRNILKVKAETAIVLNIDRDHMECYEDERDLVDCFRRFCQSAKTAFVCADDENCVALGDFSSFGIQNTLCDYRAVELRAVNEKYSFTVEEYGKALCRVRLNAIGRCNVYNALAAFAALRSYGFHEKEIKRGVETFTAVKRRFERIGGYHGASFVCDYAHHPREIAATVATAKGVCKGKLYVVFQPHTYSRTKLLMADFINVLQPIENVAVYKTYPAREKFDEEGCAKTLSERIGSLYMENVYVMRTWLKKTVREGDMVLFLGAGDIYYAAQYILKELS